MTPARTAVLSLALLLSATALLPGCTAADTNRGTIKVHDGVNVEPPMRNQPHVPCAFFIEGFMLADSSGTLEFSSWPPTGDKTVVMTANWTADSGNASGEFHFLAGPFSLPDGHYRVEAFGASGHVGGNEEHFAKAKMFWTECPPTPPAPPPQEIPCPPTDVTATANADGSVTLTVSVAAGADGTNVYRRDADGDWQLLATLDANTTTFTDTDTTVGVTYTYTATTLVGVRESTNCALVEVTTIPEFPTAFAVGLAAIVGLAAYAAVRRKK